MKAEKVIDLVETIRKPVKIGSYNSYSAKQKKSSSKRGITIVNCPPGISKAKLDANYKKLEKIRIEIENDLQKKSDLTLDIHGA